MSRAYPGEAYANLARRLALRDRDRVEQRELPVAPSAAQQDRGRRRHVLRRAVQHVVLLQPTGDDADVAEAPFVDVVQLARHVGDGAADQLTEVSVDLLAPAEPAARDLVDALDVVVERAEE